eukprot:GEMP01085052.1.p1 GENE.GEMP01085052.1~~GEMP01085052.1.p1  ORF type:complete len:127 (+),score=29.25 GEMP01085052.1:186-566(+)
MLQRTTWDTFTHDHGASAVRMSHHATFFGSKNMLTEIDGNKCCPGTEVQLGGQRMETQEAMKTRLRNRKLTITSNLFIAYAAGFVGCCIGSRAMSARKSTRSRDRTDQEEEDEYTEEDGERSASDA